MKKGILLAGSGAFFLTMVSKASLVAHYTFDETSGTTAYNAVTGHSNGEQIGSVTVGQSGVAGYAYEFDGTSAFVDVQGANYFSSIIGSGQLTISLWFSSDVGGAGGRSVLVSIANDGATNSYSDMGLDLAGVRGQSFARHRTAGNGVNIYGGESLLDSEWHHLVMVVDVSDPTANGTLTHYVDGQLVGSTSLSGTNDAFAAFNNLEIGRLGRSSPTDYFAGLIDDVQVYSSVLTYEQVIWLQANPGQAIPEPSALILLSGGVLSLLRRRRS